MEEKYCYSCVGSMVVPWDREVYQELHKKIRTFLETEGKLIQCFSFPYPLNFIPGADNPRFCGDVWSTERISIHALKSGITAIVEERALQKNEEGKKEKGIITSFYSVVSPVDDLTKRLWSLDEKNLSIL